MAATNKTENYELNQWVGTDPVLMADFNADNAKIDAALAAVRDGGLKMACGSYTGTGTCGSKNKTGLSFDFKPMLVIVRPGYDYNTTPAGAGIILMRPVAEASIELFFRAGVGTADTHRMLNVVWGDKDVQWYYNVGMSVTDGPISWQMNSEGVEYYYTAFGF